MEKNTKITYFFSREIFLRILGGIYLLAFLSLWIQLDGLIGHNGILPAANFLKIVSRKVGVEKYWLLPTLCWFNTSDGFMHLLCAAGVLLSAGVILGFRPWPVFLALWVFYLSLVSVGQDFLEFQWDNLLLETGFLAVFLSVTPLALWLCRWLLFRLMFSSGVVKLASGDPVWRNLTALNFHYETQPLPTWIGWYVHQLPHWFQKFSVLMMFGIELAVPFLIFAPRRLRLFACAAIVSLQGLIFLTGNYCFFNFLTVALCLLLVDDSIWPGALLRRVPTSKDSQPNFFRKLWSALLIAPVAGVILIVTTMEMFHTFRVKVAWPTPVTMLYHGVAPFRSVNSYGLFAVMTTSRREIVVEGSNDGRNWLAYEFKWKPGDLKRPPSFVEPHQPRLDWQMWFAALGSYRQNLWFINFLARLLEGSPQVLKLMDKNPFPNGPPRYLRAVTYDYHFTNLAARKTKGTWWRREPKGLYCPILSLK